jgi:hypothetical protein
LTSSSVHSDPVLAKSLSGPPLGVVLDVLTEIIGSSQVAAIVVGDNAIMDR